MTYLNNAATTWPKPPAVTQALHQAWLAPPEGQGRGGRDSAGAIEGCRQSIARLLGIADAGRLFFASGATDALNRVLHGLLTAGAMGYGRRPTVVVSQTEHNSVLRPVYNNPSLVGEVRLVECDEQGYVAPEAVRRVLQQTGRPPALVVLNHCSNVTGAVQDAAAVADVVHRCGSRLLLDVSQSAGCVPVDADGWQVDALVFTGHKALFGPQGTGGYYVRGDLPLRPLLFGGTGRDSSVVSYSDNYEHEVGTQNAVGLAALRAGVDYVLRRGVADIMAKERAMVDTVAAELSAMSGVTLHGWARGDSRQRGGLLSFTVDGLTPSDVAYILRNTHDIVLRSGLHCSPLIHRALGTDRLGTVRLSVSDLTTADALDTFLAAMRELTDGLP